MKKVSNKYILDIANKTIARDNAVHRTLFENGNTNDIITAIKRTHPLGAPCTKNFAKYLKGPSEEESIRNVWTFTKYNLKYRVDTSGYQFIKTPAAAWHGAKKVVDCKSYSIFISSILTNLGIRHEYRFVAFSRTGDVTHVYIIAGANLEYTVDCCMPAFNKEKPYQQKKDIDMTKIVMITGTDQDSIGRKLVPMGRKPINELSAGEATLWIARDRMHTERNIVGKKRGIGCLKCEKYLDGVDMLDDAIEALGSEDIDNDVELVKHDAVTGVYANAANIYGIGATKAKAKRAEKKVARKENRTQKKAAGKTVMAKVKAKTATIKNKTTKLLDKAKEQTKKGVKAVTKAATAPARLFAKKALEVILPKAAPFFLYLFINDPKIIAKLPAKVKRKRATQVKIADIIVNSIGMQRVHFMGICRNGIMKKYHKSPENVIADLMKKKISGVGVIPPEAITAVIELFAGIVKFFKGKKEAKLAEEAEKEAGEAGASDDDWDGETALESEIRQQDGNSPVLTDDGGSSNDGGGSGGSGGGSNSDPDTGSGPNVPDGSSSESDTEGSGNTDDDNNGAKKPWKSF